MRLWGELPIGCVVSLVGAAPAALALTLAQLPAEAPAVIIYRPMRQESAREVVASALDELEGAALDLFPAWLPDAAGKLAADERKQHQRDGAHGDPAVVFTHDLSPELAAESANHVREQSGKPFEKPWTLRPSSLR